MSADGQFVTYDPDGAIFLFDRQPASRPRSRPQRRIHFQRADHQFGRPLHCLSAVGRRHFHLQQRFFRPGTLPANHTARGGFLARHQRRRQQDPGRERRQHRRLRSARPCPHDDHARRRRRIGSALETGHQCQRPCYRILGFGFGDRRRVRPSLQLQSIDRTISRLRARRAGPARARLRSVLTGIMLSIKAMMQAGTRKSIFTI